MGPHPFPTMVRDFQAVISKEIKEQLLEKEGKLPDAVIACVGGGSNAIGAFYHFINDPSVRLIGCEAAGRGVDTAETAATIATGRPGIFHGMKSYFCQDQFGQIAPVYSISAGLDYPGIGPEHAHLHDIGRVESVSVIGGGSQSDAWCQILANVLGREILTLGDGTYLPALAVAAIARRGLGETADYRPFAESLSDGSCGRIFCPSPAAAAVYDEAYRRYSRLYPALRGQEGL